MRQKSIWNLLPPAAPVVGIILVGLVLLSGLLYYRAVKIQRFLEPALAFSQPRNEFSKRISSLFQREFGKQQIAGIDFSMGVIRLRPALLFSADGRFTSQGQLIMKKLASLLLSLMSDEQARSEISMIIISARAPYPGPGYALNRMRNQMVAGAVQDGLFTATPELARYQTFFSTAIQPIDLHQGNREMEVDIRIMPSEFLHIKVLERLEKYSY